MAMQGASITRIIRAIVYLMSSDGKKDKTDPQAKKQARLAEALRSNLQRRKKQSRERTSEQEKNEEPNTGT